MLNKILAAAFLFLWAFAVHAAPRYVITPSCLLEHTNIRYHTLAAVDKRKLIVANEDAIYTLSETNSKTKQCRGFKDVTVAWQQKPTMQSARDFLTGTTQVGYARKVSVTNDYAIRHDKEVNVLLAQINPSNIWHKLTTLTNFPDRYAAENFAGSANGVKAANWIKSELEAMKQASQRDDVTIFTIDTQYIYQPGTILKQPSIVMKIGNGKQSGIVLGAHMDTLSAKYELKPGADDDGSGSAAMLETARVMLNSGLTFKRPIYFVWYAAEELGLIGSQSVVAEFEQRHIPVAAAFQFDCLGYAYQNDLTMWLLKDEKDVDDNLTQYTATLITHYVKRPVKFTSCGYSCSDHASWMHKGIAAASLSETSFETHNDTWHSANDTMDKLSLDHLTDFTKLAVAAAVELAEPV